MRRLHLDGLDKVKAGKTSLAEVLRVTTAAAEVRTHAQADPGARLHDRRDDGRGRRPARGRAGHARDAGHREQALAGGRRPPERRPPSRARCSRREEHPLPRRRAWRDRQHPAGGRRASPGSPPTPGGSSATTPHSRSRSSVCWLDEPADGLGSRAPGNFCAGIRRRRNRRRQLDRPQAGDGRDVVEQRRRRRKLASVDADLGSRRDRRARRRVGQLTSPAASPITDPTTVSASFAVTTNQDAAAVVWSVDGATAGHRGRRRQGLDLQLGASADRRRVRRVRAGIRLAPARAARCAPRRSSSTASRPAAPETCGGAQGRRGRDQRGWRAPSET